VLSLALTLALAAPPVPTLVTPIDGGWAARRPAMTYSLPPTTSSATMGAEVQIVTDLGVDAGFFFTARSGTGPQDFTGPTVFPDAGRYTWFARGVEDGGLVSAWSSSGAFRIDDLAPAIPTSFTVSLDSGVLTLTSAATTDLESGVGYYHFGLSRIDQLDGSVTFNGTQDLRSIPPNTTLSVMLGPGTWVAGLHVHDVVGNAFVAQSLISSPQVVNAATAVPAPAPPEVIRLDGGTWATAPYVPIDFIRFRVDAGSLPGVIGFTLSRKAPNETEWELCATGPGPIITQTLPAGDQDVRVAVLALDRVTPWSAPVRVFVDEVDPNTPNVTASIDGGAVVLTWPSTRDNFGGSGVLEYRVSRCCVADASVSYPNVPHTPDASISVSDDVGYGAWSWTVLAVDRAGHLSGPSLSLTPIPPRAPANLRAASAVTNQPVSLAWDDERDGGYVETWTVLRVGSMDAGTVVATQLATAAFVDDAPEGTWSYVVLAQVGALVSNPGAQLDGVIRDQTPPDVTTPQVQRLGARTADITWTATDALSGLATVRLERDSVDLGVQTSPFTDTPPVDGTHRYRVVATDRAGNVTTSSFSADFVTPGAGIAIDAVDPQTAQCARSLELDFTASEAATWSLVMAPAGAEIDSATGHFTWTPATTDVGAVTVRVRAQGASSVDQRDVALTVECERRSYDLSCGCTSVDVSSVLALGIAALLLRRRQRG
jgi:hypothetical protein